jgi:PhoH-like ATPase
MHDPHPHSPSTHQRGLFRMTGSKRIYALDTNVLLHDPTSLFRFEEHDVFIPMTVLEELDEKKKGASEVSRNGRQVSRFLNELVEVGKQHDLSEGLELHNPQGIKLKRGDAVGRLYFQHRTSSNGQTKADNQILSAVIELREQHPDRAVILVTKDINLRIKASINGIVAEDYENDRALDDFSLLFTGAAELTEDFWELHPEVESWTERGRTFYKLNRREEDAWYPNE